MSQEELIREIQADIRAQVRAAREGWQPFETVPRDGTAFDLWVVGPSGGGSRIPNCRYAESLIGPDLQGRFNRVGNYLTPTHWRRLPEPPQ